MGLGIFSRWVTLDKMKFCQPCSETYFMERREAIVRRILGLNPERLFTVQRVRTRDPDRPNSRRRLVGLAAFTDKGVCFVQLGEHNAADSGMGFAFGIIGHLIAEAGANKEKRRAMEEAEMLRDEARDFNELLRFAPQTLFYPLESLKKVKIKSGQFCLWADGTKKQFVYEGGRKVFKLFKPQAQAYCEAVKRKVNPATLMPREPAGQPA